jgi:hypothetical protein
MPASVAKDTDLPSQVIEHVDLAFTIYRNVLNLLERLRSWTIEDTY